MDTLQQRFGIRTIEIKPDGVFLNGKHIKIHNTNNHQEHAGVGSALPDYLQYYRMPLLEEMGANAYRTSHNAPTPELLDVCDSPGMLVLDEQDLLNSSIAYMNQFERLIRRDRNHPSVFLWSIGNEEGWIHTTSNGKCIAQTLLAKKNELDPTRTSTYAADVANVFNALNKVISVRVSNYRQFAVADYNRDHPNQPIIGTEMGSTVTTKGIYRNTASGLICPTRILLRHGGPAGQKNGGSWRRKISFGLAVLFGQVLITVANQRLINGPISIPILVSWMCAAFLKIFIISIKAGGQTKMYCIFLLTGTGKVKEVNQLMHG